MQEAKYFYNNQVFKFLRIGAIAGPYLLSLSGVIKEIDLRL